VQNREVTVTRLGGGERLIAVPSCPLVLRSARLDPFTIHDRIADAHRSPSSLKIAGRSPSHADRQAIATRANRRFARAALDDIKSPPRSSAISGPTPGESHSPRPPPFVIRRPPSFRAAIA